MPGVKWLPEAIADVHRLHGLLKAEHPEAAARTAQTILGFASLLMDAPDLGRPMDEDTGRRELFVSIGPGAYVLRYVHDHDQTAFILRVWHSHEHRTFWPCRHADT